jgi:hypothetical protein
MMVKYEGVPPKAKTTVAIAADASEKEGLPMILRFVDQGPTAGAREGRVRETATVRVMTVDTR